MKLVIGRSIKTKLIYWFSEQENIIVLYGARQVGKTTLVNEILSEYDGTKIKRLNGDNIFDRELFDLYSGIISPASFIGDKKILFIDEAQKFPNIGINLKILYDAKLDIKIIVTGSSALDLATQVNEPLTGRMIDFYLYPLSAQEIYRYDSSVWLKNRQRYMIYGLYPSIYDQYNGVIEDKIKILASNYLYKDILELEFIRKSDVLIKLLQLLALQIGSEVSYQEVGQQLGLNVKTVERYIDLLEKTFILYTLPARSSNPRNEIKKSRKVYFWDLGIRNALIGNFNPVEMRADAGAMRENFFIIERAKYLSNSGLGGKLYFWRNYQQQEIDLVEQRNDELIAYECKRNPHKKTKDRSTIIGATQSHIITPDNYLDFLI